MSIKTANHPPIKKPSSLGVLQA